MRRALWASLPALGAVLAFIATCTSQSPLPTDTVARAVTSFEDPTRQAPGSLVYVASAASDHASDFVSAARLDAGHFVTATTTNASNGHHAQVSVWAITDTAVSLTTSADDSVYITEVAVARLSDGLLVTAMRTQAGFLRIATWTWDGTTLALASTQETGIASQISLAAVSQAGALSATSYQIAVGYVDGNFVPAMNVYKITPAGGVTFQTGGTLGTAGSALSLAAPGRPFGSVVTAQRTLSGALHVTPCTIDEATGARTMGVPFDGGTIQDVKLAPLGYRRVAAEIATSSGTTVATFETTGAGATQTIAKTSGWLAWGTDTGPMAIVNDGGAGFATFVNKAGSGTLRTWDAVNSIGRLDFSEVTKVATNGTPATLAWLVPDRLVASYVGSDNRVRVVLYRNYDMPLVGGEWPTARGATLTARQPTDNIATFGNFNTKLGATDLTVAAGRGFVGFLDKSRFTFTDRAGALLEPAKWANAPMTAVDLHDVFKPVIDGLNRRLAFQEGCDPELGTSSTNACQASAGDARMLWDDATQRFVLLISYESAGSRSSDPPWKGQHYIAFAVSQSADPRDGFYVYATTESKVADWPRIGVGGGMLMFGGDDSLGKGFNDVTAALHVFDMATLASPVASVTTDSSNHTVITYKRIPVTKVPSSETFIGADKDVFHPLIQFGPQPKMEFLFRWQGLSSRTIYLRGVPYPFGAPVPGGTALTVAPARVTTSASTTMSLKLTDAKTQHVYLTFSSATAGALAFAGRVASGFAGQYDIQVMKVPFTISSGTLTVPAAPLEYTLVCPGRSAGSITCSLPASAIALDGTLTASFMRWSNGDVALVNKEAYYLVLDANMAPLKQGVMQPGLVAETSTPQLDFSTVAPDPGYSRGVWVAQHAVDNDGVLKMASGRVIH